MTQAQSDYGRIDGKIIDNFFVYYKLIFPSLLKKISWLWFLMALFVDSLINYPILKWTQRRYAKKPITFLDDGLTLIGLFVLLLGWAGIQQLIIEDVKTARRDSMIMTCIMLVIYSLYLFLPTYLVKNPETDYKKSMWLKLIGPLCVIALNYVKDGSISTTTYGSIL